MSVRRVVWLVIRAYKSIWYGKPLTRFPMASVMHPTVDAMCAITIYVGGIYGLENSVVAKSGEDSPPPSL